MAIAIVQSPKYANKAGGTVTASFTDTPTQGNLLIASVKGVSSTDVGTISGWTNATSARVGTTTTFAGIFYKVAGAAETKDVTAIMSSSIQTYIIIEEWGGIANPVLDKTAKTDNSGAVTSKSTNTTSTTTIADELLCACVGMGNIVTSPSWSNSFSTGLASPSGAITFVTANLVVSSTGAQETTCSWTTSRVAGACIATFGASPAGVANVTQDDNSIVSTGTGPISTSGTLDIIQDGNIISAAAVLKLFGAVAITQADNVLYSVYNPPPIIYNEISSDLTFYKQVRIGQKIDFDMKFGGQ